MADTFHSITFDLTTGTAEVALDITDRCTAFLNTAAAGRDGLLTSSSRTPRQGSP